MKEDFLAYLWQHRLYDAQDLKTVEGERLEVVSTGRLNRDAGPDFFNAKIKIGETTWAGNVEIHLKSSDWLAHQHDKNLAYDNIILHLVFEQDVAIKRRDHSVIPTLELRKYIKQKLHQNFTYLQNNQDWIPCEKLLDKVDDFTLRLFLDRLLIERLEIKTKPIIKTLKQNHQDWEATFYQYLAKAFGFKINAVPFELVTQYLPLSVIRKHRDSLVHLEALLFGIAGFLEDEKQEDYPRLLQKEYTFLKHKFSLENLSVHLWKFSRMRPPNFPTIRIAQFAQLLFQNEHLFSSILATNGKEELVRLFQVQPSEYWQTHYVFDKESAKAGPKKMGRAAIEVLIINAIAPFIFVYGDMMGNTAYKDKALDLLSSLRPEKNHILEAWKERDIVASNAYESQALLHLKNQYCDEKRCLECAIGNRIIRSC